MEATSEGQPDVAGPVPRRDDDGPGERRGVDAGLESGRAPADLDRDIHTAPVRQLEDGVDEVGVRAGVRGPRPRRRMRLDVARADPRSRSASLLPSEGAS